MDNDLKWLLDDIRGRLPDYATANDYYYGRHRLAFATAKFRNAFGSLLKAFADNLCPTVVDTVADRLQVTGFSSDVSELISAAAAELWRLNRMDRRAGEAHTEALKTGDAYAIVWPDSTGLPRIYPQFASVCSVEYDGDMPGRICKAGKLWRDNDQRWRLTLYYPERIEKYATTPTATADFPSGPAPFQPFELPGEAWPLPNIYNQVPVFHFANNAFTGEFGRSELADVIPLQDAQNKSVTDMLVAMEFIALPQRWITGIEPEFDDLTGKIKQVFVPGADRIWTVGAPDANFGQFPGADLLQFVAVQESLRTEIARVSRTPLHHLMPTATAFPSGEAMKTAEQPLTNKVRDRQIAWGNVWEDVMTLALRMTGVTVGSLNCDWLDTTPRGQRELIESLLLKKQLGVSDAQLLREAGYTSDQIARFAEERAVETAGLGEQLLAAFDRNAPVQGRPAAEPANAA